MRGMEGGDGRMETHYFMAMEFQFCKMERVLEMLGVVVVALPKSLKNG